MDNGFEIREDWQEGVPILEVDYSPSQLFRPSISTPLSETLIEKYRSLRQQNRVGARSDACIVYIKASTAGSPLVRAIFELYKVVYADDATLYCVNYPKDYMESLTSLGLTALPRFRPKDTLEEALRELAKVAS
jgi:hypothetical protein